MPTKLAAGEPNIQLLTKSGSTDNVVRSMCQLKARFTPHPSYGCVRRTGLDRLLHHAMIPIRTIYTKKIMLIRSQKQKQKKATRPQIYNLQE